MALALLGALLVLLLDLGVKQPGAQHLERLVFVLKLRLLVLADDHQACRQVRDPHRRIRGVDALASRAPRAVDVDAQVVGVDLHVHLLGLGQHRHGDGRGVDAALGFGGRHALHAVNAALVLEGAVGPLALDHDDRLFHPSRAGGMAREDFNLPAAAFAAEASSRFQAAPVPR